MYGPTLKVSVVTLVSIQYLPQHIAVQILREMQQSCQQRVGEKGWERHRLGLTGVIGACKVGSRLLYTLQLNSRFCSAVPAVAGCCPGVLDWEGAAGDVERL